MKTGNNELIKKLNKLNDKNIKKFHELITNHLISLNLSDYEKYKLYLAYFLSSNEIMLSNFFSNFSIHINANNEFFLQTIEKIMDDLKESVLKRLNKTEQ